MDRREARFVAWAGVLLACVALVASLLLPGSQAWLCRNGLRFACEAGATKIAKLGLRHQRIPRSADASMLLDGLASQLSFDSTAPRPVVCDEAEPYLALYEANWVEEGGSRQLQRGDSDFVMADIELDDPPSDIAFTIDLAITLHAPPRQGLFAEFGTDAGPVTQRVTLASPAGAGHCKASFLVALGKSHDQLATAAWSAGAYRADVGVRGGALANQRLSFTLP